MKRRSNLVIVHLTKSQEIFNYTSQLKGLFSNIVKIHLGSLKYELKSNNLLRE